MKVIRAILYHLAARLFEPPSDDQTDAVRALLVSLLYSAPEDAPWLASLAAIAQQVAAEPAPGDEYRRLFVVGTGAIAAQPYASRWLESEERGRAIGLVQGLMAQYGLGEGQPSGRLADHIVSELDFMAFLAERGDATLDDQRTLLFDHLLRWLPCFLAALREGHPAPLYDLAGGFLGELLEWDAAALAQAPAGW